MAKETIKGFSWDKADRKFVTPEGKQLTGREVLDTLNILYYAYVDLMLAWRLVSEGYHIAGNGLSMMDRLFMQGRTEGEDFEYSDAGDMGESGETPGEDSEGPEDGGGVG